MLHPNEDPKNVYIASLPSDFKESELREMFKEFGRIRSARVMRDSVTGEGLGYGFVLFDTMQCATAAVQARSNYTVRGQRIQVRKARAPNNRQPYCMPFPPGGSMYFPPGGSMYFPPVPTPPQPYFTAMQPPQCVLPMQFPAPVSNLPQTITLPVTFDVQPVQQPIQMMTAAMGQNPQETIQLQLQQPAPPKQELVLANADQIRATVQPDLQQQQPQQIVYIFVPPQYTSLSPPPHTSCSMAGTSGE